MKTFKEYVKANINEGKSFDPISGRKLMSAWIMAQEEKSKSTASFLKNGVKISNQMFRYYSTPAEFIQGLVTNSKFKEDELTDIVKRINRQKPDKLSEYAEKILSSMNENVNEQVYSKEIEGLIKNAVSKKEVYVNSDGSQMSPSKSKQTPIKVTNYIVSTAKMKPLSLNHVRSAMDNNGIFVRKVRGNPIAVVKIDK